MNTRKNYIVHFYNDKGQRLNHWLNQFMISDFPRFNSKAKAKAYIEEIRSYHAISFTQTLIIEIDN